MTTLEPQKGMIFQHAHWLNDDHKPMECKVTQVRQGFVTYREWFRGSLVGGKMGIAIEGFPRYCGRVVVQTSS